MADPRYRKWTGVLALLLTVILVVGNGLHPPLPKESVPALTMIAGYGIWSAVHMLIASSYIVLIPVALGVAASFEKEYPQVRIGAQLIVFGSALGTVYITIHLTMLTYLAQQYALATDAATRANVAFLYDPVYPLSDAFDVISLFAIFIATILYGTAMLRESLYPTWLGKVAIGGGVVAAIGRVVHELMQTTTDERVSRLCSPLQILDPLFQIYSVLSTMLTSNWWHLGMAGRLPKLLCPPSCVGQQDFVGFDYYWGIPSLRLDRLRHLLAAASRRFEEAPVWPGALHGMLRYHANLFPHLPIVIFENGCVEVADRVDRATYLRRHVRQVQRAIRDGVNVAGYLCWSITSNREWGLPFGPGSDFGLYHVELDADPMLARTPTAASKVFRTIIRTRRA